MYGIYGDIIEATKKALERFDETKELLEYPEVQADKAYYLSILSKYNNLKVLNDNLTALISALEEERATADMLAGASGEEERVMIYEEISSLKVKQSKLSMALSDALGCKRAIERAYCRFKFKDISSKIGVQLVGLIKSDLLSRGAEIEEESTLTAKGGYVEEVSFVVEGEDVITRLIPLVGAHKVYVSPSIAQELRVAVTPSAVVEKIAENDLKIDVFHSHGAGGQNINKVETAVRVTHLPTGIVVVCQDERSQLKNKRRALETIQRRLRERSEQVEKKRIEADITAQFNLKHTPISFDMASSTMTDTRLKAFARASFPPSKEQFNSYLNGLMAL